MENIKNEPQKILEKRIELAENIENIRKQINDIEESMNLPGMEPSAKIKDTRQIDILKTELKKLIAEHDSLQ